MQPACRVADSSNIWGNFIPAPPGSTGKYQFTPGQTFALLPQLAETTPFFLSMSQAQKLSGPYTVSLLASAFLSGNIIFFK